MDFKLQKNLCLKVNFSTPLQKIIDILKFNW